MGGLWSCKNMSCKSVGRFEGWKHWENRFFVITSKQTWVLCCQWMLTKCLVGSFAWSKIILEKWVGILQPCWRYLKAQSLRRRNIIKCLTLVLKGVRLMNKYGRP